MGRYYNGDINGKFWFGIQSSDDADSFGVMGEQPSILNYYFDESDLDKVQMGIEDCKTKLGEYKVILDKFFKKNNVYNNGMLAEELKISEKKVKLLLKNYARLELGNKIKECLKEQGSCEFTAEC